MTSQITLQVYPDKIAPALSSTLFCLLSDARQDAVAHIRYKDEIGLMETTYSADSKHSFCKGLGLIACIMDAVVLSSTSELIQSLYKEVLEMNILINPVTIKKEL